MSKKLTHEFIAMRTKCDRLESIKNLNLWGNDLEDISVIKNMYNLEVVSLSVNKIRTLKDFSSLKNLRELYLRKNSISDLSEIKYLVNLTNLKILWLSENPLAEIKNYRTTVVKLLPQITKLDDHVISNEEREICMGAYSDEKTNEDNNTWDEENVNNSREEDENVFENNNINYDNKTEAFNYNEKKLNNNYSANNEIYSNNDKKNKIKDKFNYQNNNINVNPNPGLNKKYSANFDDSNSVMQNFENINLKENVNNKIKRNNTQAYEPNANVFSGQGNNNEYANKKIIPKNSNYGIKESITNTPVTSGINTSIRGGNILNCVLMLLKELNDSELEMVKTEIDRKISKI